MTMTTLAIVDMQSNFSASEKPDTIIGVQREIALAKRRRDAIVILEYRGYSKTRNTIINAVVKSGWPFKIVEKGDDDGSAEVVKTCNENGWPLRRVRVCGVNRMYCVKRTIEGLLMRLSHTQVEIAFGATGDDWYEHTNDLEAKEIYDKMQRKQPKLKIL